VSDDCPAEETLVCFMKCSLNNRESSPVIQPDLFADLALPSDPFAMI
jgi:hypothetical protein